MKRWNVLVAVALLWVMVGAGSISAQCIPYTMPKSDSTFAPEVHHHVLNYQGKLVDYQGKLVHDTLSITFSVYADSLDLIPLWTETQSQVIIWGGVYNVLLGTATPMPDTLFKTDMPVNWFDRWLGITIGCQSEMSPRQRICIVGHSINTDMIDGKHLSDVMNDVMALIEAMDWGRPQRACSLYEGNCEPDCKQFEPLVNIYINDEGPDTMRYNGSTPTFQVLNQGSGDAVKGMASGSGNAILGQNSDNGYGGKFTSSGNFGLYAEGSGSVEGGSNGAALFDGDVRVDGEVTINSTVSGSEGNRTNYALRLDSRDQGMWIQLNSSNHPSSDHNYVTFSGSSQSPMGRIEGQTATDILTDWVYWWENICLIKDVACATADLVGASTSSTPCVGLGACVTTPVPSLIVAASVILGLEVANMAVFNIEIWTKVGVAFESKGADYAEWLERLSPEDDLRSGDIVGVFGGRVSRCTKGAEQVLCISTSPIVVGNLPEEGREGLYERVAFMGQVPVKVIGAVNDGDYIIPSGLEDGTGIAVPPELMTADEFAKVVGRAWSSSPDQSAKLVNMVIGLNSGDVARMVQRQQDESLELKAQITNLASEVAGLKDVSQKLVQIEASLKRITGEAQHMQPVPGIETAQKGGDQ